MTEFNQNKSAVLRGGEFLVREATTGETFTPEELTEEQHMFSEMTRDFVETKIDPVIPRIEKQEEGLTPSLIEEMGQLGIIGAAVPENWGGMGADIVTDSVLAEEIGKAGSFGVSVAAHTGIGTLPILYYGTPEQKAKYLPELASGALKSAYCLTEPGSGSDAMAAKTKAVLNEAGTHYVINGQKMWITNGGFADIFIVFAQIDGDKFTGFIVPGDLPGITRGPEEEKLGIKGSSTRMIFFENVEVPKENILGDIGKGHYIAFNVLNIGRFKLCAMAIGGSKKMTGRAVDYAAQRNQFGTPIASFGAIQHKLAEMAIRTYVGESATYRTAGAMRDMVTGLLEKGETPEMAKLKAAEEYSIECAILKVLGSEIVDYVVDENVQVHGGMGFSEDGDAARMYRDARINRIFEGTNEINRLLSVGMMVKKAMKGQLDLLGPAMALQKELTSVPSFGASMESGPLAKEKKALANAKKAGLLVAGAAVQKFMQNLEKEQEVMMNLSDMLIDVFAAESAVLRVEKLIASKGEEAASLQLDMVRTYLTDAIDRVAKHARDAVSGFAEGDELRMMLMGIKRYTKVDPFNTIAARRRVAAALVEANGYCF